MPAYRIIKPLPDVLTYRGGVRYRVRTFEGLYSTWNLTLQKEESAQYAAIVLFHAPSRVEFDRALADGFDVPDGGAAEKIMESLCRLGYAERAPLLRS